MLIIDEVILDEDLFSKILNLLPPSYLNFHTSLTLSMRANPAPLRFEELVGLLLQEEQSRKNKSFQVEGTDQALVVQNRNKGKVNNNQSKSGLVQSSDKSKADLEKPKRKGKCHFCKKYGHYISECSKHIAKEKKKESSEAVSNSANTSAAKEDEYANTVQDSYAFIVCSDFSACSINEAQVIWYFDSGASRHITSRKDLFRSLDAAPAGKQVTCANNSSYPIKGVGEISFTIADGTDLCLSDVLYVPGIKRNLLSVSSLSKNGFRVIFEDDTCVVHDKENGYGLTTTGTLENVLFMLDHYEQ